MELLRTESLLLRQWSQDDLDAFFDLYSRWEVARWLGRQPRSALTTREEAGHRLDAWREQNRSVSPPLGLWAIVPTTGDAAVERPIGTVLLLPLDEARNEFEIGWHLHPAAQGRGFATLAAQALVDAARTSGITRLLALTDLDNAASAGVALRLGMEAQGQTDDWFGLTLRQFSLSLAERR